VYCYAPERFVDIDSCRLDQESHGIGFIPRALSTRVLNQRAVFTVHAPPTASIDPKPHWLFDGITNLIHLRIPFSFKEEALVHLDHYGINSQTLFPDLDGLSAYVNSTTQQILRAHLKYSSKRSPSASVQASESESSDRGPHVERRAEGD